MFEISKPLGSVSMTLTLVTAGVAVLCGVGCQDPGPIGSLEVRLVGPAYPRPRCAKGPAELGPVNSRGEPAASARVELPSVGIVATSDADGRARFDGLTAGSYPIKIAASGFHPAEATGQVNAGTALLQVRLEPCVSAANKLRVGFDAPVELRARATCGSDWDAATFSWRLVEGPEVSGSVSSWQGPTLRFRTRKLEEVRGPLPDQGGILSFSPDQAGEYVFEVTARSAGGQSARHSVLVTSTNATGGMNSVPTHDVQYFLSPNRKGPWNWKITDQPQGWAVTLGGADTRTPFVQAIPPPTALDAAKEVLLQDTVSGTQFSLVMAYWYAVPHDCGRAACHAGLYESWQKTRHGTTWRKLVDGELLSERGAAAESCAACHAMGWDPSVANGGYDDVVGDPSARFPEPPRPGNFAGLPEPLKVVSNIFCLACHGPARVDPPVGEQFGRFSVGVCARCHDRKPEQDLVAQWRTSRMSRTIKGDLNGAEQRPECTRCHSAQGFYYSTFALGRPPSQNTVQLRCCDNLAPITCQACHSPMYAKNPAQVFRYGAIRTASGLDLKQVGAGALCMSCHTTDHDVKTAAALDARVAPHSPQTELAYGRAGYAMTVPANAPELPPLEGVACARNAGQGCVTCHMDKGPGPGQPGYRQVGDHTFRMISSEGVANTRPCQACHPGRTSLDPLAGGDWDGDGSVRSVGEEFKGLMALLRERLTALIKAKNYRGCDPAQSFGTWFKKGDRSRLVIVDAVGFDLGDCDRNGFVERLERPFLVADAKLYQAAYNHMLLELDGSRGLHNLPYAIKLLQRTLISLADARNLPDWELYR